MKFVKLFVVLLGVVIAILALMVGWLLQMSKGTPPGTDTELSLITHSPLCWILNVVILTLAGWVYWRWALA